jgi:hypothetical protein
MAKTTTSSTLPKYDSNPFTLAFNSFGRLFNTNAGWAIALLVIGIFSFIYNMFGNLIQLATMPGSSSNTTSSVEMADKMPAASAAASSSDTNVAAVVLVVIGIFIIVLIMIIIFSAIATFISGVFTYVSIKSEEGHKVSFNEAFEETAKRFFRLYFAQLLAGLKIFGWSLLFIIPGIIAALRYTLLPYVVMGDTVGEKGVRSAHSSTKTIVKGRLMEVFGMATVAAIIPFIGEILKLTGNAALYKQMKTYSDAGIEKPKVHWLNYAGLMLIGLVLLFVMFIFAIIALVAVASQ